jgi:chromosome segregation ATPase
MTHAASPLLGEVITVLLSGGAGAGLLRVLETWAAKRKPPAEAAADLIKLAMEASGTSVQQLLQRLEEADDRYSELSAKFDTLAASHADCERRCNDLHAELEAIRSQAVTRKSRTVK